MNKMLRSIAVLALVAGAGAAQAIPVTVDGTEWLQPIDFINLSWNDIAAVCDSTTGDCGTGALGAMADMGEWTWASVDDINNLFNYFLPGDPLGPGPDAHSGPGVFPLVDMLTAGFTPTFIGGNVIFIEALTRTGCGVNCVYETRMMYDTIFGVPPTATHWAETDISRDDDYSFELTGAWGTVTKSV